MRVRYKRSLIVLSILCVGWLVLHSSGQQVPQAVQTALTNPASIPFIAAGGTAAPGPSTNLAGLAVQQPFIIGMHGYSMLINCAGTNATTTTNVTVTIEYSPDGINWPTNTTTTWVVGPLGVQYAPVATNNPQMDASAVMGNFFMGRIRSFHHTNTGSIFITNFYVMSR